MSEATKTMIEQSELDAIAQAMNRKYASLRGDRQFSLSARKSDHGIYATVTLGNANGSFHYPVEGRVDHEAQNQKPYDAAVLMIDYIDSYFEEFLKEGGVYLPIDWSQYECDGVEFQLKGQIHNLELERMADELLAAGQPQA